MAYATLHAQGHITTLTGGEGGGGPLSAVEASGIH